jgi:pimeloyl-ACP methyl ester carboxylesterase
MVRAIETGTFDDDMIAWSIAVMKHTDTLRSEMRNNPFVTLRGTKPEVLLTDNELARLRSPVLLLWGDEDTNAGEPEAKAFAARLPNAALEIVREAGHTPWIDELDFCAEQTRAFLST